MPGTNRTPKDVISSAIGQTQKAFSDREQSSQHRFNLKNLQQSTTTTKQAARREQVRKDGISSVDFSIETPSG